MASKSGANIATLVVIGILAVPLWYAAPLFFPVWRWRYVNFATEAQRQGVGEAQLRNTYQVIVRHDPRGDDDPVQWQVVEMKPEWTAADEEQVLVRVSLISENTGESPSGLLLGSGHRRDKYFKTTAWRFAPGSFGKNAQRPVLVYSGLEKLSISEAEGWDARVKEKSWFSDDLEVDDGWVPPDQR